MPRRRLRTRFSLALILLTADAAAAARPGTAPPPRPPAAAALDEQSYGAALRASWNYQSCGIRARAGDQQALAAELRAIESLARSKGLGPTLERDRDALNRMLAVSLLVPCGGGPAATLAAARRAIAAFRAWVEGAPAHP